MSEVAPAGNCVLLAQALFFNPGHPAPFSTNRPTTPGMVDTIRWLEQVLNERDSTMIINFARPSLPEHGGLYAYGGSGLRRLARLSG